MKYFFFFSGITIALSFFGCTPRGRSIVYGTDACHNCLMTIMDRQHAAEIVTAKGKIYTFDSGECMIYYLRDSPSEAIALYLINDYSRPGELVEATSAHFLISKKIPSPMGAFLSAFENPQTLEEVQSRKGGERYTWTTLLKRLK